MKRTCFRCLFAQECYGRHQILLFFSPLVLYKFEEWRNRSFELHNQMKSEEALEKKLTNENEFCEEYDEEPFYKYIKEKLLQHNNSFENTYKEIYLDLYLCERCCGLHNIDIILFHKRDHPIFLNMLNSLTDLQRKTLDVIFHMMESKIYKNMISSVDIILFFLYLFKKKLYGKKTKGDYILNETHPYCNVHICNQKSKTNVTLQLLSSTFYKINSYFVMHLNMEKSYIKRSIYKLFAFVFIYVYFTFYRRIYDSIDIKQSQLQILSKLFKYTKLIWTIELETQSTDTEKENEKEKDKEKEEEKEKDKEKESKKKSKKRCHNRHWTKKEIYKDCRKIGKIGHEQSEHVVRTQDAAVDDDNKALGEYNKEKTTYVNIKENRQNGRIEKGLECKNMLENSDGSSCTAIRDINIYVSFNKLCICGSYNKYNKNISQTKWVINQTSKSATSIEECVSEIFKTVFCFSSATFIGSGREDKDVRMMNTGRPFVLILNETKFSFLNFFLFFDKLNELKVSDSCHIKTVPELQNLLYMPAGSNIVAPCDKISAHSDTQKVKQEKSINSTNDRQATNEVSSPALFAMIWRKNTGMLYDVVNNTIVWEKDHATIYEKKEIEKLHISTSYNKEIEELLCSGANRENLSKKNLNGENLPIVKKEYNINDLVEVKLNNLVFTTDYKMIKKIMKYGEERKKAYKCLIYHTMRTDKKKIEEINISIGQYENKTQNIKDKEIIEKKLGTKEEQKEKRFEKKETNEKNEDYILKVFQKTPVRVLHRRSLLKREKYIYEMKLVYVHPHCSLLYILCESGLYIKEFVNGDRGRTFPNLKHFFNDTFVNVLNLDVSKLVYI